MLEEKKKKKKLPRIHFWPLRNQIHVAAVGSVSGSGVARTLRWKRVYQDAAMRSPDK